MGSVHFAPNMAKRRAGDNFLDTVIKLVTICFFIATTNENISDTGTQRKMQKNSSKNLWKVPKLLSQSKHIIYPSMLSG